MYSGIYYLTMGRLVLHDMVVHQIKEEEKKVVQWTTVWSKCQQVIFISGVRVLFLYNMRDVGQSPFPPKQILLGHISWGGDYQHPSCCTCISGHKKHTQNMSWIKPHVAVAPHHKNTLLEMNFEANFFFFSTMTLHLPPTARSPPTLWTTCFQTPYQPIITPNMPDQGLSRGVEQRGRRIRGRGSRGLHGVECII